MKYTQNYNFRKPEDTDPADIQDLNYNADAIDGKLKEIEDWEAAHLQASNPHNITPALIGAETPTGAQQKANQAETNAKSYADIVTNSALNSAKDYADDVLESANSHTDQVASDLSQKLNETRIKVLDVEQDVSNISKVLTNLNPNQESKQKVSGYGIITLPKNAANGQLSVTLKGETRTNIARNSNMDIDSNGDGVANDFTRVLHANHTGSFSINNGQIIQITNSTGEGNSYVKQTIAGIKPNTSYCISVEAILENVVGTFEVVLFIDWYQDARWISAQQQSIKASGRVYIISTSPANANGLHIILRARSVAAGDTGKITFRRLVVEEADKLNDYISSGTKSTVGAMRLKSVSADETETSTAYVIVTDADTGEILELRSLPNGTKDEFNVAERRVIQRTKKIIFDGSENWDTFTKNYADSDGFYRMQIDGWATQNKAVTGTNTGRAWNDLATFGIVSSAAVGGLPNSIGLHHNKNLYLALPRDYIDANYSPSIEGMKQYLADHPITLIYQLAEPVEIPVQVNGTLLSYPSGTVYVENVVADAGLYSDGITILHEDLPISSLEKLSKVDFVTGIETELDISKAVIAADKLSFMHPDLVDGDIVFFTYEYDRESTEGETEIEYYDSRYVIKDSVTGKFYKWHIAVAVGVPSIGLVEV